MDKEEERARDGFYLFFFPRVKKRRDRLLPSIEEGFESVLDLLLLCDLCDKTYLNLYIKIVYRYQFLIQNYYLYR